MAVRRGPVRLCRADEAEADSLVKRPGGPEVVGDVEEEVQVVFGGGVHHRFEQCERDSLSPGGRDDEEPAHFRRTRGAGRRPEDHVARDRHVVRFRDPRLQDRRRPEPLGRVGGPVHGIAADLVDAPQRFDAHAEVCFIAVTDSGHRPRLSVSAETPALAPIGRRLRGAAVSTR